MKGVRFIETVNELNAVLKGEYMAIHAYEQFLQQVDDPRIRESLQKISEDHRVHTEQISERIRALGGEPVDGHGLMGEVMLKMKGLEDKDVISVLKDAFAGELQGIEKSAEIVKGDLDSESMALIRDILKEDRAHLHALLDAVEYRK